MGCMHKSDDILGAGHPLSSSIGILKRSEAWDKGSVDCHEHSRGCSKLGDGSAVALPI